MIQLDPIVLFGAIGTLLGTIVTAGIKKVWVFGYFVTKLETDLDDMTTDRNFWRDTALKAMGHTDEAFEVVKKKKADA